MMGTFWDNRIDVLEQLKTSDVGYNEQLLEVLIKAEREQLRRIIIVTTLPTEYRTIGTLLQDGIYKLDPWMHESGRPWTNGDTGHTWVLLNLEGLKPDEIATMNPTYQILTAFEAPPMPDVILYTEFVEHGLEAQKPWHDKGYYIAAKDHVTSKGAIMSMIGPPPKPGQTEEITLFENKSADQVQGPLHIQSVRTEPIYKIIRANGRIERVNGATDTFNNVVFGPEVTLDIGDRLVTSYAEKIVSYKQEEETEEADQ